MEVSRQAVSKWESGSGYPEMDKLESLAAALQVTEQAAQRTAPKQNKTISIRAYNHSIYAIQSVSGSQILSHPKNSPDYLMRGVDRTGWFGDHGVIRGFYRTKEDMERELDAMMQAISRGDVAYELQYAAEVEMKGWLGQPRFLES